MKMSVPQNDSTLVFRSLRDLQPFVLSFFVTDISCKYMCVRIVLVSCLRPFGPRHSTSTILHTCTVRVSETRINPRLTDTPGAINDLTNHARSVRAAGPFGSGSSDGRAMVCKTVDHAGRVRSTRILPPSFGWGRIRVSLPRPA